MSEAGAYRCPSCGAPAAPKASPCAFCRAELHPVRCPWCFEWTDAGARDCPRCGSSALAPGEDAGLRNCPSCRAPEFFTRVLGGVRLSDCVSCGGVWADSISFKKLCEDRSTHAAYLGAGAALPAPKPADPSRGAIRYRPCPVCGELMNRFNFASCSGVILDACKPHGVWFDPDELRSIVAFISGGGLDVAREKERAALEVERRRVERRRLEKAVDDARKPMAAFTPPIPVGLASARGLLKLLFELGR